MPRLNVQAVVHSYLEDNLNVPVSVTVPNNRPKSFVTVRREGGGRMNKLVDVPGVGIEMWAETEAKAAALAEQVADLMQDLEYMDGFAQVVEEALYSDRDSESGSPRWYGSYTITTYEYKEE